MHQVAILEAEIKELKTVNVKQKQKQEKHCIYINQRENLTIKKKINYIQNHDKKKTNN